MDTCYEYWCSDEKNWIREWSASAPTECKNNAVHTISDIKIKQELHPGGREVVVNEQFHMPEGTTEFFVQTIRINANGDPVSETTFSWPMPIYIYEINLFPYSANMDGDSVDTAINPDFLCGVTTDAITAGETVIPVSETVLKYVRKPGWFVVEITDGVNSDICNRVIAVDRTLSTITVETATVNSFSAGAFIKVTYFMMKGFEIFTTTAGIRGGASKLGGSLIPANVPVRVYYHNSNGIPKDLVVQLEYCW